MPHQDWRHVPLATLSERLTMPGAPVQLCVMFTVVHAEGPGAVRVDASAPAAEPVERHDGGRDKSQP